MRTMSFLTIPGLVTVLCAGFACSSSTPTETTFTPPPSSNGGSSANAGTGNGASMGGSTGQGTGGTSLNLMSGGSMNGGGAGGAQGCVGVTQATTPIPPILEFLIDTSGSMAEVPMNATMSKYIVTRDALIQSFTTMQDGTGTGLIFYPNTQNRRGGMPAACIMKQQAVPIALLNAMVRTSLTTALQGKTPAGATPTHDAYVYALDTLQASTLPGSKYVVLVTDGAPTYALNCTGDGMAPADTAPLIQEAANALTMRGIKTFVIGSPGSESARGSLSQMATQGGTAPPGCSDAGPNYCHFDMTTVPDLSVALNDALKAITGSAISCNYTIPPASSGQQIDRGQINVSFTNSSGTTNLIHRDPDPAHVACNTGWQLPDNTTQIQLCPDQCALVKADPNAKIDVVVGCTMIPF